MTARRGNLPFICARCLRAEQRRLTVVKRTSAPFSTTRQSPLRLTRPLSDQQTSAQHEKNDRTNEHGSSQEKEQGAMSRRLAAMSEANLEEGGRSARKAVEEAGFDQDLKEELLAKISGANVRSQNQAAFSQAEITSAAGKGTREQAAAPSWTGTESVEDAALRMLTDAHKPIRGPAKIPFVANPARPPKRVDTGRPKQPPSSGTRLANARDRTSAYSYLKDDSLPKNERDRMRQELKERFTPAARQIPATLQGLSSLANERIEDAMARGQFKNLPRGQKIERDHNMSSPFLDTTEYFMNKIIQRQDIVPPWIEKQQELVSTAARFRGRLRNDWKRHAVRMIAARGGSLAMLVRRAEEYAAAEAIVNPIKKKVETLNAVDKEGHMSQIKLSGDLNTTSQGENIVDISVTEKALNPTSKPSYDAAIPPAESSVSQQATSPPSVHATHPAPPNPSQPPINNTLRPFRDPDWERIEASYQQTAIDSLNSLTRSYNLMAPNLARKPYFNLERELRSCYADIAPELASALHERANAPRVRVDVESIGKGAGLLEGLGKGGKVRVYDERKPKYGFREFWRDFRTNIMGQ